MGGVVSSCKDCFGSEDTRESYASIGGGHQAHHGGATAVVTPDPVKKAESIFNRSLRDERRRQLAEAAEKRLSQQEHRGIQNMESVRRQQQRKEEMERKEEELARLGKAGEPGLRWQV